MFPNRISGMFGQMKNWYKANPSLGQTIQIDRVRDAFHEAQENPAEENVFKQLRLNMWVSSLTRFIPEQIYDLGNIPIDMESLKCRDCYGGLDLSSTGDITAFVLMFPPRDETEKYIICRFPIIKSVDWRQTAKSIDVGDTVYVYTGRPVQAITHKCVVLETDIPAERADHSDDCFNKSSEGEPLQPYYRYMKLRLVKVLDCDELTYVKLVEHGLKGSIQSQQQISQSIQGLIDTIDR